MMDKYKGLLNRAINIAADAHKDKTDRYEAPYIGHVTRVMNMGTTEDEKITGILHDVIEDTDITFKQLIVAGVPPHIITALQCLTKTNDQEDYNDYIQRVAQNQLAIKVKLNDLTDNMDIKRMPELKGEDVDRLNKYLKAYRYLKSLDR